MDSSDKPLCPLSTAADPGALRWQWPSPPARLLGRSIQLFRLHGLLDAQRRVLVLGPQGIGKRSLVCAYGHRFAAMYAQQGLSLRWTTSARLLQAPPAAWDGGLWVVSDVLPSVAGPAQAVLSEIVQVAPRARIVALGAAPGLHSAAAAAGFAVLDVPPLSIPDGVALLIAESDRHQAPPDEQRAAADLVTALGGVPARLREAAATARDLNLTWKESLRRHLI